MQTNALGLSDETSLGYETWEYLAASFEIAWWASQHKIADVICPAKAKRYNVIYMVI
jgi:hypothetical protein